MALTFADYAALVAPEAPCVEVETGQGWVLLRVSGTVAVGAGGSVELQGASDVPLGQDNYPVRVGDVTDHLFIVPLADNGTQRTYEAIFN